MADPVLTVVVSPTGDPQVVTITVTPTPANVETVTVSWGDGGVDQGLVQPVTDHPHTYVGDWPAQRATAMLDRNQSDPSQQYGSNSFDIPWVAVIPPEPTPGVPPTLDLDTVRGYVKVPTTQLADVDLTRMLNGCSADQWARCAWDELGPYPDALAQALLRRIQREIAARNLPLGMVGLDAAEYGPQGLPYLDALVEEHERGYRRVVLA